MPAGGLISLTVQYGIALPDTLSVTIPSTLDCACKNVGIITTDSK